MAYRKDLERNAAAMMKVKNPLQSPVENGEGEDPVTPLPGETQDLSDSKRISQKKFERKLKRAKEGEVFKTPDTFGSVINLEGPRPANITQTYIKKGKKTFIKRESPSSDWNTVSYLKVKNKP